MFKLYKVHQTTAIRAYAAALHWHAVPILYKIPAVVNIDDDGEHAPNQYVRRLDLPFICPPCPSDVGQCHEARRDFVQCDRNA